MRVQNQGKNTKEMHTNRCAFFFAFKLNQTNDFVFRQANLRLLTDEKTPAAGGRLRGALSRKKQGEFQRGFRPSERRLTFLTVRVVGV